MATVKRLQTVSFLVILAIILVLILFLLKPFVNILALGSIVAILFYPVYLYILKKIKYPSWASLLTVLIILVIVLGPIYLFGQILFNELNHLYTQLRDGHLVINRSEIIASVPPQLQTFIERFSRDINGLISNFTSNAFASFSSIASNVFSFFLGFFMLFFTVFYLLRDGEKITAVLMDLSPMAAKQEQILMQRIITAVNGIVKGQFLVAVIQGLIATLGLFIFGVPEPFLWGALTVIAALVPNIGTALIMVPAILYLFITGNSPQAIGLAIWSVVVVGLIDNFLGPRLVGSQLKLHPLLVLLAVIGGIQLFGFLGFLIGPILMAIFVQMIDMYRTDFKEYTSN
jgi:predicted PurR-regulated permease PerM